MAFDFTRFAGPTTMNWLEAPLLPKTGRVLSPLPVGNVPVDPSATGSVIPMAANDPWQGAREANVFPPAPQANQGRVPFMDETRKEMLRNLFLGMAMGTTPGDSLAKGATLAAQGRANSKNVNQTVEFLKSKGMDEGQARMLAGSPPALNEYLKAMVAGVDPMDALRQQKLQLEIQQMQNPGMTDAQRNLEWRAREAGLQPGTPEYQKFMADSGGSRVEVNMPGQPNIGSIPQGYQAVQDPETKMWTMQPIPGGPEDKSRQDKARLDAAMTSTDVITSAASRALSAAKNRNFGAAGTSVVGVLPWTDSAEVMRNVNVLKSNATIENLNQMRQQSPTGGALGNVTEKEGEMLAAKAGALDPNSPTFERDVADYERTLLRVIHGKEVGDQIFEQTRQGATTGYKDKYGLE